MKSESPLNTSTLFDQPPQRTSPQLILFFDECMPRALGARLVDFLKDRPERPIVKHLLDFYKEGTDDRTWVRFVKENKWLPVTADRGQTNRGEKLPKILRAEGLVYICLSGKVHGLPIADKGIAIVSCWPEIVSAWKSQTGACHSLRRRETGGFKLVNLDEEKANRSKKKK